MDELTKNEPVIRFEKTIAEFFGAPNGVATDCCTNALELCFRLWKENKSDHRVELVHIPKYVKLNCAQQRTRLCSLKVGRGGFVLKGLIYID